MSDDEGPDESHGADILCENDEQYTATKVAIQVNMSSDDDKPYDTATIQDKTESSDDEGRYEPFDVVSDTNDSDYIPESEKSDASSLIEEFPYLSKICNSTEDVSTPVSDEGESDKSRSHYNRNKDTASCSLEGHCSRKKTSS